MSHLEPFERDIIDHIILVQDNMYKLWTDLAKRSRNHDDSKLRNPERPGWKLLYETRASGDIAYGTPEYKAQFDHPDIKASIRYHYEANRHHPEHFEHGVNDMTLVDLIEMLCDWSAASTRFKDSDIESSINHNIGRFGLSPQLATILLNTAKEYGL